MPAKDIFHDTLKLALQKDGWTITHDPLTLEIGLRQVYADLGAEKIIAARKDSREIAIEVKTFAGASNITEFHLAVGQFLNYRSILRRQQPGRTLYLAISTEIYNGFLKKNSLKSASKTIKLNLSSLNPTPQRFYSGSTNPISNHRTKYS